MKCNLFQNLKKYDKLALGFSGGADSTALALKLIEYRIPFEAVHFNHHLRAESANNDAEFCSNFCQKHEIKFTLVDIPVNELKENHESIETAARRLRMEYWEKNFTPENCAVLLAHHKDDVLENFFIRSLRGSSTSGLSGLREEKYINGVSYLRPMLRLSKKEIFEFLNEKGSQWCEDESNKENIFTRNIIRNKVIPELESLASIEGLYRTAENINFDALYIEEQAEKWLKENTLTQQSFLNLHPALRPRVIRLFINKYSDRDFIPGHDAIQRVEDEANKSHQEDISIPLGDGAELKLATTGEFYLSCAPYSFDWNWQVNKELKLPYGKLFISLEKTDCCEEFFKSSLSSTLIIRNWQAGDRMIPFSRKSETKVKDLFTDRKTPHEQRKKLPLIFSENEIIWIPHVKRAEFGRCKPNDETIIISYERL